MWLEILPPFAIMVGALSFTGLALGLLDRFQTGGKVSLLVGFPEFAWFPVIFNRSREGIMWITSMSSSLKETN